MYIGVVPRFAASELTLTASKMGLTLRAQAYVKASVIDSYASQLATRYLRIAKALQSGKINLFPLKSAAQIAKTKTNLTEKVWMSVAQIYSENILDHQGVELYSEMTPNERNENVLVALARFYFQNSGLTLVSAQSFAEGVLQSPAQYVDLSKQLFSFHLGDSFTADKSKSEYLGYLTLVYPIAADTDGPFAIPSEGVHQLGIPGSIEARWWSNKWYDEFGGFPYLMFTTDGVAFHGPISNRPVESAWYLRRDFASHGCMRMSPSDILELRALLPSNISHNPSEKVTVIVKTWPDVADWHLTGVPSVIDVGYYGMPNYTPPTIKTLDAMLDFWKLETAQKRFFQSHYAKFNGMLPSKNTFDVGSGKFTGLPNYEIAGGALTHSNYLSPVSVYTFPVKKQRILQYREPGVKLTGFDDNGGLYPPAYFNAR